MFSISSSLHFYCCFTSKHLCGGTFSTVNIRHKLQEVQGSCHNNIIIILCNIHTL